MKAVRRFGLVIGFLLIGLLIGKLGAMATVIVFSGLFIVWFMLWDERKYAQTYHYEELETEDEPYRHEPANDFYYIDSYDYHDTHFHKSA
ncbi:hypothetical protein NRIC_15440 [Enterococcus florum]|uniref:Uncharacterized protein n=1 Tax=Enterococcus florum TaxID=2480627 RepID=A0A4P5PJZ0_9ENTE|nr:hypothetical protein [Enterococcus florum]GCF93653.1 hypothetical protein NRIC_15440 [Enterococcus florum]